MKFLLTVIVVRLTAVFLVIAGIYCLQQGFIKTGGWLIAGGILSVLCTSIEGGAKKESEK